MENALKVSTKSYKQSSFLSITLLSCAFLVALVISPSISSAVAVSMPTMWGIDEDDGQLFSVADYTQIGSGAVAAGFTDYGQLKWNNGGTIEAIGANIEAFALDTDGTAYMALDASLGGTSGQVLLSFNINNASTINDNVVTVLGTIAGGATGNISGLGINPLTGELFALDKDHTATDKLLKISKTDGSLLVDLGQMTGLSEAVDNGEDMVFNNQGVLYVVDDEDTNDELYIVDISTAAITSVVDNDMNDGLDPNLRFEALGWDPDSNNLIGYTDSWDNDYFVDVTLANGNNTPYGQLGGLTDVEGLGFVPVPEPATLSLLVIGSSLAVIRRRRK